MDSPSPASHHDIRTISWSAHSVIMTLIIVAIAYAVWQMWTVVLLVLAAVVIASFVGNISRAVSDRRVPRIATVICVYVGIFLVIASLLYLFVPAFIHEATELTQLLPKQASSLTHTIDLIKGLGSTTGGTDIVTSLQTSFKNFSQAGLFQILNVAFGGIVNLVLVVVLSFYLSIDDRGVDRFIRAIMPTKYEEYASSLWLRVEEKISHWFRGQLMLALILAAMTYLGLWIFDVPYAFMLSLLAAVLGLVPFGIALAGLIAVGIAFLYGGFKLALLIFIWYVLLQQIENYILQPLIIRRVTGVPSTIILLSLVICGTMWGFLGLILAIPLAVFVMELVKDYEVRKQIEVAELCEVPPPSISEQI